jgi:hypothetical protein
VLITLGFRRQGGAMVQLQELAPPGWETLRKIPDITDFNDNEFNIKIENDISNYTSSAGECDRYL